MMKIKPALLALLLLAGCSRQDHGSGGEATEMVSQDQAKETKPVPTRMAYSYDYRFSVPSAAIATAQDRHVAMCDRLGLRRCRVLEMHRSIGDYESASVKLEVASDIARPFTAALTGPVESLGGSLQASDVQAEDLARQIVDVEARVRAKEALAARLTRALETRGGSTADLVATEKALSEVQEELDAADGAQTGAGTARYVAGADCL